MASIQVCFNKKEMELIENIQKEYNIPISLAAKFYLNKDYFNFFKDFTNEIVNFLKETKRKLTLKELNIIFNYDIEIKEFANFFKGYSLILNSNIKSYKNSSNVYVYYI